MNRTVISGVNRIEGFLNNQLACGLREVNPAELQAVEGGLCPLWWGAAGALYLGYLIVTGGAGILA